MENNLIRLKFLRRITAGSLLQHWIPYFQTDHTR